jgi:hypothetical protein
MKKRVSHDDDDSSYCLLSLEPLEVLHSQKLSLEETTEQPIKGLIGLIIAKG